MSAKAGSANLITGTRILCSIALLFCQTFSPPFFALYIIAGLTDMIDGTVARKAGTLAVEEARTVVSESAETLSPK